MPLSGNPQPADGGPPPPDRPPKSIVIVDDHPFLREGMVHLIGSQPDLALAGQAGNPAEALSVLALGRPDLVMADISMPGRSGFDFIKDLLAQYPDQKILVVSAHDENLYAERALRSGARGYVMKDAGVAPLLAAIRTVLQGGIYVSPAVSTILLEKMTSESRRPSESPIARLTDREFEIFQLVGQGKSTRDIAEQLHLSGKTVDTHRANIKAKLELRDATALVRYAVRWVETK
jgi:DNA-binding NarL/FixJ family response regulator